MDPVEQNSAVATEPIPPSTEQAKMDIESDSHWMDSLGESLPVTMQTETLLQQIPDAERVRAEKYELLRMELQADVVSLTKELSRIDSCITVHKEIRTELHRPTVLPFPPDFLATFQTEYKDNKRKLKKYLKWEMELAVVASAKKRRTESIETEAVHTKQPPPARSNLTTSLRSSSAKAPIRTSKYSTRKSTEGNFEPILPAPLTSSRRVIGKAHEEETLEFCHHVLQDIIDHPSSWPFRKPVDPVDLNIPDYFDVIKNPMDLGTVQKKLNEHKYPTFSSFVDDVNLVWINCMTYNGPHLPIHSIAKDLSDLWNSLIKPKRYLIERNAQLSKTTYLNRELASLQIEHATLKRKLMALQPKAKKPPRPPPPSTVTSKPKKPKKHEVYAPYREPDQESLPGAVHPEFHDDSSETPTSESSDDSEDEEVLKSSTKSEPPKKPSIKTSGQGKAGGKATGEKEVGKWDSFRKGQRQTLGQSRDRSDTKPAQAPRRTPDSPLRKSEPSSISSTIPRDENRFTRFSSDFLPPKYPMYGHPLYGGMGPLSPHLGGMGGPLGMSPYISPLPPHMSPMTPMSPYFGGFPPPGMGPGMYPSHLGPMGMGPRFPGPPMPLPQQPPAGQQPQTPGAVSPMGQTPTSTQPQTPQGPQSPPQAPGTQVAAAPPQVAVQAPPQTQDAVAPQVQAPPQQAQQTEPVQEDVSGSPKMPPSSPALPAESGEGQS